MTDSANRSVESTLFEMYEEIRCRLETSIPPWLRKHIDADDIVQESYTAAWNHLADNDNLTSDSLKAWIYTVAQHKLRDRIRYENAQKRGGGKRISNGSEGDLAGFPGRGRTPSSEVALGEAKQLLENSIAKLDDKYQYVVRRRFFDGVEVADLAAELSISVPAVRMLVKRTVQKLHHILRQASA